MIKTKSEFQESRSLKEISLESADLASQENRQSESDRRRFMRTSLLALASSPALALADESIQKDFPSWSTTPGKGLNEYGQPRLMLEN